MAIYRLYWLRFPNSKLYIGLTSTDMVARWRAHQYQARSGSRVPISAALRKYGTENVEIRVLVIGSRDYIKNLEIAAIAVFRSRDRWFGYNVTKGGDDTPAVSPAAITRRELAMSAAAKAARLVQLAQARENVDRVAVGLKLAAKSRAVWADPEKAALRVTKIRTAFAKTGNILMINGRPVIELAKAHGISHDALRSRIKDGWNLEDALSTPVQKKQKSIEIRCARCGKAFLIQAYRIGLARFCSRICYSGGKGYPKPRR